MQLKELKGNKAIYSGVKMIFDKLNKVLEEYGISSYKSVGEEFNPDFHEALMMKKTKKKTNHIIEEFEKGYKYHDRVIRHAKVVVSQ